MEIADVFSVIMSIYGHFHFCADIWSWLICLRLMPWQHIEVRRHTPIWASVHLEVLIMFIYKTTNTSQFFVTKCHDHDNPRDHRIYNHLVFMAVCSFCTNELYFCRNSLPCKLNNIYCMTSGGHSNPNYFTLQEATALWMCMCSLSNYNVSILYQMANMRIQNK